MSVRELLWRSFGSAGARRAAVQVQQLGMPSVYPPVQKVHIPRLHELPKPAVSRDIQQPLPVPSTSTGGAAVAPPVPETWSDTLQPIPIPAITPVGAPIALPLCSRRGAVDLIVGQTLVLPALACPPVHGKTLVSQSGSDGDTDTERMDLSARTRRPLTAEPKPEPYLSEELYALLLPPAQDLVGLAFDWPADLYPFQMDGVRFLIQRRHALLADDMGLGKTIQAIAAIRILLKAGWIRRALVVCPASIKTNWLAEFKRWAPEVVCELVQGSAEDRKWCWGYPCHVLITNYRSLINDHDYGYCDNRVFDVVVLDEAQRIKNSETKTSRTSRALLRRSSWCLTGTPIENSADDMRSIFGFVHPKLNLHYVPDDELRDVIEPYFLRRRKQEVLDELPPKRIADRWLSLSPAQALAYERARTEGVAYLRELGHQISITHVLALITRLKQICNFDQRTGQSCKLDYLREGVEDIAEAGEKALVFSQFTETLEFLRAELAAFAPVIYDGRISTARKDGALQAFTEDPSHRLMLVSLKAGGVGPNLQAASWVFHYDRWWTPAAERQAEDRAHRIGQRKALMIERLMCEGTIEERIHQIQQRKQRIIDDIVEADYEDGLERLTTEEMFEVVGLEPELAEIAKRKTK